MAESVDTDQRLRECNEAIEQYEDAATPDARETVSSALATKVTLLYERERVEEALVTVDELIARFGKSDEVKVREHVAHGLLNKGAMLDMVHRREEAAAAFGALLTHFRTGESDVVDEYLEIAAQRRQKLLRSYR